jgi:hypothetical protein
MRALLTSYFGVGVMRLGVIAGCAFGVVKLFPA